MPLLREGQTIILRSTVGPGTTEWLAGYLEQLPRLRRSASDFFVAHVPERIAVNHFLEEIETLPTIVGGVGEESGAAAAALFDVFGATIEQTTPVQAELAKIWTNILRYATFAIPNLLMMQCERHGANVFEVIDLINHDYPRGGMAMPGLTAGTCLRKDFAFSEERSAAPGMLLAVSRVHETVPQFLVEGVKRRLNGTLRDKKIAVLGLTFKRDTDDPRDSLSLKLIRLLERELCQVARHDPFLPDQSDPLEEALLGRRGGHRRHEPLGVRGRAAAARAAHAAVRPVERVGRRAGVRLHGRARPGRSMNRVLVTGGAGTIGQALVRRLVPRPGMGGPGRRPAHAAAVDARDVRDRGRRPARAGGRRACRRGRQPCRPPGRDRRRDRQLPQAAAHAARGEHGPLQLGLPCRARAQGVDRLVYVSSSMVFERATQFPTTGGARARRARRLGPRTASRSSPARCTAARSPTSTACATRSCARSTPTARARRPSDEPGIAHAVPDLIRKVLAGQRPLQIFGSGEQTRTLTYVDDIAEGIVAAMAHPAAEGEDFNISASDELTVAQIARLIWEACGEDPAELEFEHVPSFEVDVQRRWPSVEKAAPHARLGGRSAGGGRARPNRRVDTRAGARAE